MSNARRMTDTAKLIRQHLLRIHNGDYTGQAADTIDEVTERLEKMVDDAARGAVFTYRAGIIAKNYDTELKTYDYDGIAQMVLEKEQ